MNENYFWIVRKLVDFFNYSINITGYICRINQKYNRAKYNDIGKNILKMWDYLTSYNH